MFNREKLVSWLESNKQIGKVFDFNQDNQKFWSSAGIQKWKGKFKVYVDEILESEMDSENYSREEVVSFNKDIVIMDN